MSNQPTKSTSHAPTKKHLARMQREQMWRRWLLIGTIVVLVVVIGVLLYGLLLESVIQARQPVAIVDSEQISTRAWQSRVRFQRANLLNNASQTYQFAQSLTDPSFQASIASQLQQIKFQLDAASLGDQMIDAMLDEIIIEKEAAKRGITVSAEEVNQAYQGAFGYYPNGEPTAEPTLAALPTSTLSALQLTMLPPTPTPAPTEVITATQAITATQVMTATATATLAPTATAAPTAIPTETPLPSATPNTLEQTDIFKQTLESFSTNFGIDENEFKEVLTQLVRAELFRRKLADSVLAELNVPRTEQQVWAQHILVAEEQQAQDISTRLQAGEDFCKLAAEFSTDTSNKDNCGDLGWFAQGAMVKEFEDAALALRVGEISQPVQSQFGYHLIRAVGNEDRPLTEDAYVSQQAAKFQEWLQERKTEYVIEVLDDRWQSRTPLEPAWPAIFDQFIAQVEQLQQQLQATPAPVEATPAP